MARGLNRQQAARLLLSILEDTYGGDGWDDPRVKSPRMIELLANGYLNWPMFEKTVDIVHVQKQADELVESGIDPRHLVEIL